ARYASGPAEQNSAPAALGRAADSRVHVSGPAPADLASRPVTLAASGPTPGVAGRIAPAKPVSAEATAIGIVTALPIECFAILAVLTDVAEARVVDAADQSTYYTANAPSRRAGRPHHVVVSVLPEDGGIAAAHASVNLQRSWPQVQHLIMCGIACGVPRP